MEEAKREKATDEHSVIGADRGEGYTVFSIPVGVLYRPSEGKLKNAKTKDYMGKAKLVAARDSSDAFTTFTGVTRLRSGISPSNTFVGRSSANDSPTSLSRVNSAPPSSEPFLSFLTLPCILTFVVRRRLRPYRYTRSWPC